jgi:alpha-1,2-glucosyltransferase
MIAKAHAVSWKRTAWEYIGLLVLAAVLVGCFFAVKDATYFGDEGYHFEQIELFLQGKWQMRESLTTIPGYHLFLAAIAFMTGHKSLLFFRVLNLCFSILSVFIFHRIARLLDRKTAFVRTVQYVFIPILFPFFFLLYTDAPSLLLGLLSLFFLLRRRYALAGFTGILNIAVRQNSIIWLFFLFAMFLWEEYDRGILRLAPRFLHNFLLPYRPRKKLPLKAWRQISAWFVFLAGFALFAAFVWWNGGIAIGDKASHPFPGMHLGNVYFLLFLFFFLFLPTHLWETKAILLRMRSSKFVIPVFVALYIFFMFTFFNTHWYNQDLYSVFFRNRILVYFNLTLLLKTAFFIPVAWSVLTLLVTHQKRHDLFLLFPMTLLYLLPSWLIEQRYYFLPFAFYLLFRNGFSARREWISVLYAIAFTAVVYYIVATRYLFL